MSRDPKHGGTIRIRTDNLILAEHPRCLIRDARVEDPLHVKERRDLSMLPAHPPRSVPLSWHLITRWKSKPAL
jgi:hypothetical protein